MRHGDTETQRRTNTEISNSRLQIRILFSVPPCLCGYSNFLTHDEGERMNSLLNIRVRLVATCFCLLCAGALTSTRAMDEKPKVATTHYVDNPKHFAIDVPLTWERKFPENEDERIRFIFATG